VIQFASRETLDDDLICEAAPKWQSIGRTMPSIRVPTAADLNPVAGVQSVFGWLGNADGRRARRTSVSADGLRAHIEVRGAQQPERARLVADVKVALNRLEGVDWAEVDAVVGRATVLFDPEALTEGDLIAAIEAVEQLHDASDERFPHDRPDHPADREPVQRHVFAIAADVVGVGFATGMQALRVVRIPAEIPGLISIADAQPRIRRLLENRIGRPAADVTLVTANALSQALGQGPLGLVVDIAHRSGMVGESQARRAAWNRREPEIMDARESLRHRALSHEPRPVPLPAGPVERYADRAGVGSLAAMSATLAVTRNPRRASDLLLVGIPKAATLGREAFAAQFDRGLSRHGVITMDASVFRRLDRVDVLVLGADVAVSDGWSIDEVVPFAEHEDVVECTVRARSLFDIKDPRRVRTRGAWTLAPLDDSRPLPRGAVNRSRLVAMGGRRVLALWRGDDLCALVAVLEEPAALADEVVTAAREAGLEVFLAGGTDAFARRLNIDGRLTAGHLAQSIRALQAQDHVTLLVTGDDAAALRASDVGIGVEVSGARVPWGADLLGGAGLANAWRVIDAVPTARDVSRRSALFALGGASTGAVWASMGPGRTAARRALIPINVSALASMASGGYSGLTATNRPVPRPGPRHPWHALGPDTTLDLLDSSTDGLGERERAQRAKSSTARVVTAPIGLLRASIDELANPLTPILAAGAALSAAVGSTTDAGLVGGVVVVNALVGAAQRMRTERSLRTLEENGDSPVRARVGGVLRDLRSDSLVVGDVIELGSGDTVRADCRLLEGTALEVDESAITGESLPVPKSVTAVPGAPIAERASMLYEGSVIAAGRAVALVVAVGRDTEAGRAAAAGAEPPPSGVERRLGALTRMTIPVTLASGALVTGLGFLYRRPARAAVGAGVALTVAAVPEGLPTLATITQIAAARRLASRHALVRNPRALEALGRVDQICFDKTGTLTQGKISLALISDGASDEQLESLSEHGRLVLAAARRATPAPGEDDVLPHATDQAIILGANALGVGDSEGRLAWHRRDEIPFESRRGYHAVLGDDGDHNGRGRTPWITMKGAPEVVIPLCDTWRRAERTVELSAAERRALDAKLDALGRRGLRVLAVAEAPARGSGLGDGTDISGLELLGFVCLADLARPEAATAVRDLQAAGVNVAMITGDHPSTAEAIAAELGLLGEGRTLTGADLDQLDDDELQAVAPSVSVFARVAPSHKVRIVGAYQRGGRTVAMTGDGANDAAAIRLADAGIALGGRGTAAARAGADVIIVDDRIETIVEAIAEGRAMWNSVRDAVAILVGGNLGELGFILVGSVLTGTSPLNPRQLLLVNLLTDMAPALTIALREPPDRTAETLLHAGPDASLGGTLVKQIAIRAGATATGASTAWMIARVTGTPTRARTVALAALIGTQLGQTVAIGGRSPLVLGASALSAAALVTVIQTPGLSQFFGCRPLGPVGWFTAIGASTGATAASIAIPWAVERLGRRIPAPYDLTQTVFQRGRFAPAALSGAAG
jgi:cation-transporting P-type ATPase I